MPRRELPPELRSFAFTTAEARERGVGRGRLRGEDLAHPHRGVHIEAASADDADVMARCERLRLVLGANDWFSHRTAARIWCIPLSIPYAEDEDLHVTSVGSRIAVRRAGVVGWVTAAAGIECQVFDGLPVIAPADVWCRLALRGAVVDGEVITYEWLVAAGDFLLSGQRRENGGRIPPLCTIDELRAAVARRGRGRGTAMLHSALADLRSPVDSPYETLARLGLVAHGLPEPRVQVPVMTSEGLRHADLGYPEHRLLLEYQGDEHRTSRSRWLRDLTRVQLFQDAGYDVILIGAHDVVPDCAALAERVRRALARRAAR